jgi:hypothetical protein
LTIFLQTSSRTFSSSTVSLARSGLPDPVPFGIVTGDFDGDGKVDLAVTDFNVATGVVMILHGNGDGTFLSPVETSTGGGPSKLVAEDFNGDGALDLALVSPATDQVIILIKNTSSGTFDIGPTFTATGTRPTALTLADVDKDGKDDLIVVNQGNETLSIFLSSAGGLLNALQQPTTTVSVSLNTGSQPIAITAADFNKDGNMDVAVANAKTSNVTVLFGDGTGHLPNSINEPAGLSPSAIGTANLDGGSSGPDLLVTNGDENSLSVLLNAN